MVTNYEVTRTFHPVGQGAFYSEHHTYKKDGVKQCFNIVYDCGSTSSTTVKNVVVKAFTKEDTIDILFISHFDFDHVSLIPTLRDSVKSIKKVVMPLLSQKDINFLININRVMRHHILNFYRNPKRFFGENAKLIYVKAQDDTEPKRDMYDEGQPKRERKDDSLPIGKIEGAVSGQRFISISSSCPWVFIPYNLSYDKRTEQLENNLLANKFSQNDIEKLKKDPEYTIKIIRDNKNNGNKLSLLKKSYQKVRGGINKNSMLVYSGPTENSPKFSCTSVVFQRPFLSFKVPSEAACIYTGDTDLNKVSLQHVAPALKHYVGTIQVPHHGAQGNFQLSQLTNFQKAVACPLSAGKNYKKHPHSKVMKELVKNVFTEPFVVNEDTTYQQKFII